ncbi:DUF86 domain-containing protein [Candidatus Binatia bacterium]|nr:DUF86 domain-containing protein [Candidatus Binatia bacterium]
MVLRGDSVRERLVKLEEAASGLERILATRTSGVDLRDDWAIERGLQLGAEVVLDVGNHILSAHFGVGARDYEDIISRLGDFGVLPAELRERLRGLGGFRNILVHGYLSLDRERVARFAEHAPNDFRAFSAAIRAWMTTLP